MSTSPAERPALGLVTFTAQGNRVLDRMAAELVDQCDGSPGSIAEILDQVLSADIGILAESLSEAASQAALDGRVDINVSEIGPLAESPDEAACRRLGTHALGTIGPSATRNFDAGR